MNLEEVRHRIRLIPQTASLFGSTIREAIAGRDPAWLMGSGLVFPLE
jgi:ABC-type multidrug transport system fused ATPase/permease subunit